MGWGNILDLLKVSVDTLKHFAQRITQLYEQGAEVGSVRADEDRIGEYVRHWLKCVRSGLGCWVINKVNTAWGCKSFQSPRSPSVYGANTIVLSQI